MLPCPRVDPLRILLTAFVAAGLIGTAFEGAARAQERRAKVTGAEMVFVRYGAGMNFPPFARLNKGTVVIVKGSQGEWVQVETPSAQVGFVHGKFLTPIEDDDPPSLESPALWPEPAPPQPDRAPDTQPQTALDDGGGIVAEREAVALATDLDAETPEVAPRRRRPTMAEERAAIADEMRRLVTAVADLERRIAENEPVNDTFAGARPESDSGGVLGGAVLLALVSIGIGWYLGSRYRGAQERGRQARLRI